MPNAMLQILDGFTLAFKVHDILNWSKWILVINILTQFLLSLLTFIAFNFQFCEKYQFVIDVLPLVELFCNISIYTLKSDQ